MSLSRSPSRRGARLSKPIEVEVKRFSSRRRQLAQRRRRWKARLQEVGQMTILIPEGSRERSGREEVDLDRVVGHGAAEDAVEARVLSKEGVTKRLNIVGVWVRSCYALTAVPKHPPLS